MKDGRNTGSEYDGHRVRPGRQGPARSARQRRRQTRRKVNELAWELGDPETMKRYMAPSKQQKPKRKQR